MKTCIEPRTLRFNVTQARQIFFHYKSNWPFLVTFSFSYMSFLYVIKYLVAFISFPLFIKKNLILDIFFMHSVYIFFLKGFFLVVSLFPSKLKCGFSYNLIYHYERRVERNLLFPCIITYGSYYAFTHSWPPKCIPKFMLVMSIEIIPQMANAKQIRTARPIPQRERDAL